MIKIEDYISRAAQFEQLAEEATELAHAALKQARLLRGENPTPITNDQAYINVIEEYSDVVQMGRFLDIPVDEAQIKFKHERWMERIKILTEYPIRIHNQEGKNG